MDKKAINTKTPSFEQAINISRGWCEEWKDELLSDEVLADRIFEIIQTQAGLRGFFAYVLSDINCFLMDKLPYALIFKFREEGIRVVKITIKNLIMSSAQVIQHKEDKNYEYEKISNNISDRCINLLKELDTKLVIKEINQIINKLDELGNSMDNSSKYTDKQKEYIKERINMIAN
tara:strand:- start:253 stop:780 length:528 start_codon:yes stop_codon:yes gene_type:complete